MKQSEIALTLYTVRNFCQTEKDLLNTLNKIKKIGYNAIQVSSIGPIDPKNVKKMCDDVGLIICATHEPNEEIINNTQKVIEVLIEKHIKKIKRVLSPKTIAFTGARKVYLKT